MDSIVEVKRLEIKQWNNNSRFVYSYQDVNDIPLRDSQPAIRVNWCKLIHTRESDGKILYENAFIAIAKSIRTFFLLVRAGGLCIPSGDFNRCVLTALAVAISLAMS